MESEETLYQLHHKITKFKVITNIVLHKTSHGVYGNVMKLYILIHKRILVF